MHRDKWLMLLINLLGGAAVLGSYVWGFRTYPGASDALWGGVPENIRPYITANMLFAAAGYFAFIHFTLFRLDAIHSRVFGRFGFGLFNQASVPEPYVLVGHSLGALNVQVFAYKYPKAVVGVVLMDPPPVSFIQGREWGELRGMAERMTTEWQAIADSAGESADAQEKAKSKFFRMIASEHREMFGRSAKLASAVATFGAKPHRSDRLRAAEPRLR